MDRTLQRAHPSPYISVLCGQTLSALPDGSRIEAILCLAQRQNRKSALDVLHIVMCRTARFPVVCPTPCPAVPCGTVRAVRLPKHVLLQFDGWLRF